MVLDIQRRKWVWHGLDSSDCNAGLGEHSARKPSCKGKSPLLMFAESEVDPVIVALHLILPSRTTSKFQEASESQTPNG